MSSNLFESEIDTIINTLWAPLPDGTKPNVYAVLDCARDKRIEPMLNNTDLEFNCLYTGNLSYALKRAAPHIVKLSQQAKFTRNLLKIGWGNSWGVFFITREDTTMSTVRNNCRRISKAQIPNGNILVFRYQDPRVLRRFLPIANIEQLRSIFGSALVIAMENESPTQLVRYSPSNNEQRLRQQNINVLADTF